MKHHRITYAEMAYTRNPTPARGPEVYSLDELRYYARKFWNDRIYGICGVEGAKNAFSAACGLRHQYLKKLLVDDPPQLQFVRADTQRRISKAVRNVIMGKIRYVTDPKRIRRAIGVYDPNGMPLEGVREAPRAVEFALRKGLFGPRLHRLS